LSGNVHITGAGSCTITASQAGDSNYNAAAAVPRSFTVAKAAATLALSNLSHTYDGSPKPATVTTTPSGLSGVTVTYDGHGAAPENAGSYAVVASLANANYTASDASGTLVIAKAASTTSISCPATALIYNGSARTPCTASVTGAGGLDETLTVTYTDNTNPGTAHASASFAGDDNHTGSSDAATLTIEKAPSLTSVSCPAGTTYT